MIYETFSSSGRKSFRPDLERGSWQQPTDFIFACISVMLQPDAHMLIMNWGMAVTVIIMFLICMTVYVVPLMVIQSFMGQFSSSGFISALRMSPILKGIGYVGLVLGLYFLMNFGMIAAVPIIFLINSFRPTLPWSCEGWPNWAKNLNDSERIDICNNSEIVASTNESEYIALHIPSVLYFRQHFENTDFESTHIGDHEFSAVVITVMLLVWAIIAYVFYGYSETAKFGTLLRYSVCLTLVLALVSFLALLQLPSGIPQNDPFKIHSFDFTFSDLHFAFTIAAFFSIRSLGSGWGAIISLSSFNHFKTDIIRYSWLIAICQLLVALCFSQIDVMIYSYLEKHVTQENLYLNFELDWDFYIAGASAIASLKWANLWSIIYFTMMTLSALIIMSTQLFTILKSLFDEFEVLRLHKKEVTFGLIGFLALLSVHFTSNHAVENYWIQNFDSFAVQLILYVLLLFAVLWVYGRERLQRDMEFMLGTPFNTWKVNLARFFGSTVLIVTLLGVLEASYYEHKYMSSYMHILSLFFVLLPILLVPIYGVYHAFKTTETFGKRLKDASKPTDWYPIDANERQRYEELLGHNEFTQQLCDDVSEDALKV